QLMADALSDLGCEWALVVHASIGMDEISPEGTTEVWEVKPGAVARWTLEPEKLGLKGAASALAGGTPAENARMVRDVLEGRDKGPRRNAVVLNASAALMVSGLAKDWTDAVEQSCNAIADGKALDVLEALIRETNTSE